MTDISEAERLALMSEFCPGRAPSILVTRPIWLHFAVLFEMVVAYNGCAAHLGPRHGN
jgi:hypothetical protein